MLTDAQLIYLNEQGLIPGPSEDENTFSQRTEACLHLLNTVTSELGKETPFFQDDIAPRHLFVKPHEKTRFLFGIAPDWIPVFFSNQQLAPWHGGCAWICQLTPQAPSVAFFQLRKLFANKEVYLGLYHRDDLVAHELGHVGRMAFEEPEFEELLAYRTARSSFQRWLGPLLVSSKEVWILMTLLLLVIFSDIFLPFSVALGLKLIPLAYVGYTLARLWLRHRTFAKCEAVIQAVTATPQQCNSVLYRLTDKEIRLFAKSAPKDVLHYAHKEAKHSLRWRVLVLCHFS